MAFRLLQGPIPLLFGEDDTPIAMHGRPHWLDDHGLCGYVSTAVGANGIDQYAYGIGHLNGYFYARNSEFADTHAGVALNADWQSEGFVQQEWVGQGVWEVDPLTGAKTTEVETTLINGKETLTRLPDRYFMVVTSTSNHIWSYSLSGDFIEQEYSLSGSPSPNSYISYYTDEFAWIARGGGEIYQYDIVNKTEVGFLRTINMDNKGIFYSPRYDIFISLHDNGDNTDSLRIWANEVEPFLLSDPIGLDPMVAGGVMRVQVRLTGEHGEPVEGAYIDWSLTAGSGSLEQTQSSTDADGYAENKYRCPVTGSNVTIQAETTF